MEAIQWSKVLVGDLVRVENQEMFPADLLLLNSANEGGIAHIETASLDGEKNLKQRCSIAQTTKFNEDNNFRGSGGRFQGDEPSKSLHDFSGELKLLSGQQIILSGDKQLLYRGTRLKNTKWIYGLAIYTGKNTKIILNSQSESQKMSQIEVKVNYILGFILIIQLVLCLVCAVGYALTRSNNEQANGYINWPSLGLALDGFIIFLTYFVLLNTMIPISLIVTMQMVKLFQKYFIEKDKLMFSHYRQKYVSVQSASLNQELGQIQYVFTDKTGTLTMNIMEFKIALIGSHLFGDVNLIQNHSEQKIQPICRGFRDDDLKKLLTNGSGDKNLYQQIAVKNR